MTRFAIFVFALIMSGAMSVLNAQVEVPKEVQGDEEYINWNTNPIKGGISGFKVHPNGNIIANHNNEFYEISGETGELIRAFPVQYNHTGFRNLDISSDGKYFAYCVSQQGGSGKRTTFIINYEDGTVISKKESQGDLISFLGDSKHYGLLILDFESHKTIGINIYTIAGDSVNSIKGSFSDFIFSPDGKYLLLNRVKKVMDKEYVLIELWNAQSFTLIKTLTELERIGEYDNNTFSPDGKYLGLKIGGGNIWNLQEMKLQKHYSGNLFSSYCFLENDLIAHTGIEGNMPTFTLGDLRDEKNTRLFSIDSIGGGGIDYNKKLNSIIVLIPDFISLNLEKILAKVGVQENPITSIKVDYKNKLLSISNLGLEFNGNRAKIIDIQGNIVFQFQILANQDGSFAIPLSLLNGAYILSIDEQAYKFLVVD